MLVNWKIEYCNSIPEDKQPPDYDVQGKDYWFYRYFKERPEVDVLDIHSFPWVEEFEKNKLRFYIIQALKAIPKLNRYDLIVSHGMQSGVVISLWRRLFKTKAKHIIFDIGSFASASEYGFSIKLMQFASKSIDMVIYHTSSQINYYRKFFPWVAAKSRFIRFGVDMCFFYPEGLLDSEDKNTYIICVGYSKRDWNTLVEAYRKLNTNVKLRLVGHVEKRYNGIKGIEQFPFIKVNDLITQVYNARFCVLPLKSYNYSYGQMTLMQQMALGKCVVTAKVPSLADYIEDGKTAVMYGAEDAGDLHQKLKECLADTDKIEKIGNNARKYLKECCNERIMAMEIEQLYLTVI